jgi:hypothetical protein
MPTATVALASRGDAEAEPRCFVDTGNPVAVPVWCSWLRESLETRGLILDALRPLMPPGDDDMAVLQEYVDEVSDMQRGLLRAFIEARGR